MEARENTLGNRIRKLRLTNGLTVKQAAHSARVCEQTWRRWELGTRAPRLERGGAIASAVGAPVAALFDSGVLFEIRLEDSTVEEIRLGGRDAARSVAERLAAKLEPELYFEATRKPVDVRPGARPKRRRTRAEVLAGVRAANEAIARRTERHQLVAAA